MKRILGWCDAFARKIAFVAAVLLAASAQAFNWSDYPAGAVVTVTGNATATDADMATINSYAKLCFASGTRLTFDISGDESLTCPVAATGTIVKCGTGSFALTASALNGSMNRLRYIDFEVDDARRVVTLRGIRSGYTTEELASGDDPYFDKDLHRAFAAREFMV